MSNRKIEFVVLLQPADRALEDIVYRAIPRPARINFENAGIMDFGLAVSIFVNGEFAPLHSGVEHLEDRVEELVITDFAAWAALGQRQMRKDKFFELLLRQFDGDFGGIERGFGCNVALCDGNGVLKNRKRRKFLSFSANLFYAQNTCQPNLQPLR